MATGHADAADAHLDAWDAAFSRDCADVTVTAGAARDTPGLIVADGAGRILTISAQVRQLARLSDDPLHLHTLAAELELRRPDDSPLSADEWPFARLLRGEQFTQQPYRITHRRSGIRYECLCTGHAVIGADGELLCAVLAFSGLTAVLPAPGTVQEAPAPYPSTAAAQFVVDAGLRLQRVNARVAALSGLAPQAHAGRRLDEIAPALAPCLEPYYRQVLTSGEPVLDTELEVSWEREGLPRRWLMSLHPLWDAHGRVIGINSVLQDVSAERQSRRYREAQHAITRLLAHAHSLRAVSAELLHILMACMGARYAVLWRVESTQGVLTPVVAVHEPDGALDNFGRIMRGVRLRAGQSIAGRAWATQAPCIVQDLGEDPHFPFAGETAVAGLHTGAAFPIQSEAECLGVLEFYRRHPVEVDPTLLDMMDEAGREIGHFILRRRAEQALRTLIENTPDIVARFDRQYRHVYVNRAVTAYTKIPSSGCVGKSVREMGLPGDLCDVWEAALDEVFARGREVNIEFEYAGPEGPVYFQSRLVPERSEDGAIHNVLAVTRDQTSQRNVERERLALYQREQATRRELEEALAALAEREQALRFLADANVELTSSLEYEAILIKAADLMVPRVADWCAVDLVEDDELHRLAVRHIDPAKVASVYEISRRYPAGPQAIGGAAAALHSGRTHWQAQLTDELLASYAHDEAHLRALRALDIRSYISVPLRARGRTLGVLTVVRAGTSPAFGEQDVQFVEELGRRAALAMDNALLHQAVQRELADRTRAEHALRDSEENLRFILEAAQVGTWNWDIPSGRLDWSCQIESIYGLRPGGLRGTLDEFLQHVHPEDRAPMRWALEQAVEGREDYLTEYRLMPREGTVRWVEDKGRVFYDEDGRPLRMAGICTDVTARKQVEQALRLSEERFLTALKSTSVVVFNQDRELRYTWLHDPNGHLSRGRVVLGRRDADIMAAEDAAQIEALKRRVLDTGASLRQEIRVSEERSDHYYDLTVEPVRNARGDIIGITGAMVDITHHMRLEATLREQAEQLAVADKRKDEFLAMLAHELRNPLAPIQNAVQLLRMRRETLDDTTRWGLDIIARQGDHLTRLVDDMLDVARITRGRIALQKQALALEDLVQGAVEASRPLIEAHGHRLQVDICDGELTVEADATRMVQVLGNLLNNAAKYTPDGGSIRIRGERDGEWAVIRVRDTGIGIGEDLLPRIFDLFSQGERSLDRSEGGLGLGLTLVRTLVEMHNGDVTASSPGLGAGSEFMVRLPLFAPARGAPSGDAAQPATADTRRVLVVDDNADVGESLVMLLSAMGHEVRLTTDGEQALACATEFRPEIVFLDVGLPGMDGFEVARRLRARHPDWPMSLVAFTGYGQEEMAQRTQSAGFDHHVLKPASFDVLEHLVRTAPSHPL
ncbi:PAS domain-containing protein [Ectothiorhodospiraceae bacterium 2226]|nr:PAS domain-containing protein [Ectothiorhodospiraceae bacterium 2226]